jgi:hypothetical protein
MIRGILALVFLLLAGDASRAQTPLPEDPPPQPVQRSTVYLTRDDSGETQASVTIYLSTDGYCSMASISSDQNAAIALAKAILKLEALHRIARSEIDAIRQQVLLEEIATP